MTQEERMERRIALAKFEGWREGERGIWFLETVPDSGRGVEKIKKNPPDYDTDATARERLMEKARSRGWEILIGSETLYRPSVCLSRGMVDFTKSGGTIAEAFLSALHAALTR